MNSKSKYIEFCIQNNSTIPLFFQYWWLDSVCISENWDVIIKEDKNGKIIGCFVYYTTKKYRQNIITQPLLTPFSGILTFLDDDIKEVNKQKKEQKLIKDLISKMPSMTYMSLSMHYSFSNWLPFYWKAFQQTTRYSFVIEDLSSWSIEETAANIRNKITKANKVLTISETDEVRIVYDLVKTVFENKSLTMPFEMEMLESLDAQLKSRDQRKIFISKDADSIIHAAIYIVYDQENAYNLMLGSDPIYRQSGAVPQLLHHAIEKSKTRVNRFDFEGSMLESLNDLFSGFGGNRKAYLRIFKTKNWLWDILYRLKARNDQNNR